MGNGSVLPPDIKAQVERQAARTQGHAGIGGGSQENVAASQRRNAAVNPDAIKEAEAETSSPAPAKEPELAICPNPRCRRDLTSEWNFCAKCGVDLQRGGPAKVLGITLDEEDVLDYLFRGYIVRDLKILGKHKITVKSAQPQDMDEVDSYMMNGDWNKPKGSGEPRSVSDLYMRQINSLCITAACLLKFDGESLGATLADRVKYLRERGAAFVDLAAGRVRLFNEAITEHLKKEDTLSGS